MNLYCVFVLIVIACACSAHPQFNQQNFGQFPQQNFGQFPQQNGGQFQQFDFNQQQPQQNNRRQPQRQQQQQQQQQQQRQQQQTPQQNDQTTPAATTTSTTPGPRFFACFNNCPSTSEYNPVCGSDAQNYHNEHRLRCTNECGRRVDPNWTPVTLVRGGTCQPLGK